MEVIFALPPLHAKATIAGRKRVNFGERRGFGAQFSAAKR
jgi:hypothetical protein